MQSFLKEKIPLENCRLYPWWNQNEHSYLKKITQVSLQYKGCRNLCMLFTESKQKPRNANHLYSSNTLMYRKTEEHYHQNDTSTLLKLHSVFCKGFFFLWASYWSKYSQTTKVHLVGLSQVRGITFWNNLLENLFRWKTKEFL